MRRAAARWPTAGRGRERLRRGRVEDVYRLGDDQAVAVALERGELREGERVRLVVDRQARHATECNHTATHLLHAALRQRLGTHVRQAGSAVRPDKLRFDFTHGKPLSPEELRAIEDQVNEWILESHPVRAIHTTRARAEEMGAMALFGEKYGDEVRVIEVEGVSRELCGGTHVATTSRDRRVQDPQRGIERRQRAPDRGGHRARGREPAARARRGADRGSPACSARARRTPSGRSRRSSRGRRSSSASGSRAARAGVEELAGDSPGRRRRSAA